MTSPMIAVTGLNVDVSTQRGRVPVLRDVSLHVGRGETLGLVGESGSGKSMTISAIMGLLPSAAQITSGSIRLEGDELTSQSDQALRRIRGERIGMVFQEPMTALDPVFTVGDQVAQALRVHRRISRKEAWERAVQMLDRVGIPSAARRARDYPHHFSGGMRQRVVIAMALVCEPAVLLADEPTTALDVTVQDQILTLLKDLRRESDLAMIFVSHDLGVIADVSDRVAVMLDGEIVEEGDVVQVLKHPQHEYTRSLLSAVQFESLVGGAS